MLPLPVPASVYGLVLLLAALTAGVVKLEQVKETSVTEEELNAAYQEGVNSL